MFYKYLNSSCLLGLAFAMALSLSAVSPALAGTSFNMDLSFSEPMLAAEGTAEEDLVQHYEGWDSPLHRIKKRNRPFIELTNTSGMNVSLTRFEMTIAKPEYEFGDDFLGAYAVLGTTTPGVVINSSSPDNGTTLVVDFTNGLAQGETVRFQVDIDPVDPNAYPYPDYRMVFFDVNSQVNDPSDNSVVTVSFENDSSIVNTLPDFVQDGPLYVNGQGVRPYDEMDPVEMFDLNGEIPEPTAGLLLLAAGCGLSLRRRRGH